MPTKDKETQEFTPKTIHISLSERRGEYDDIDICATGRIVALTLPKCNSYKVALADADRLVLCWNSHDELVEACEKMFDRFGCHYMKNPRSSCDKADNNAIEALEKVLKATTQTQEDKK